MSSKFCITFAGAVGSSKTPIANYLSSRLLLPIHNNDAIRTEVVEDLGVFDQAEYLERRNDRLVFFLDQGWPFILDASMDRDWAQAKEVLQEKGYDHFVISLDLSKDFLAMLYERKNYHESRERLDQLVADHEAFLEAYKTDVNLHIKDADFPERLEKSYLAAQEWIEQNTV